MTVTYLTAFGVAFAGDSIRFILPFVVERIGILPVLQHADVCDVIPYCNFLVPYVPHHPDAAYFVVPFIGLT